MPEDKSDNIYNDFLEGPLSLLSFLKSYKMVHETISKNCQYIIETASDLREQIKGEEKNGNDVKIIELSAGEGDDNPLQMTREKFESVCLWAELENRVKDKYPQIINIMSLIYVVALFDGYLLDIIKFCLLKRKEIIRSLPKRELKYEEIFQFNDMNDLQSYVIEKIISDLGYGNIKGKFDFINNKLKIKLDEYEPQINKLNELYATRNLLVHDKGIVNQIYIKAVPDTRFKPGDIRPIDDEYLNDSIETMIILSKYLNDLLISKFS